MKTMKTQESDGFVDCKASDDEKSKVMDYDSMEESSDDKESGSAFSDAFDGLQLMEQISRIEQVAKNKGISLENKHFGENVACINILNRFVQRDSLNEYGYSELKQTIEEQISEKQETPKIDCGSINIQHIIYGFSCLVLIVAVAAESIAYLTRT